MSHEDPYHPNQGRDRGAYTPPTDDDLPFNRGGYDPRRERGGGGGGGGGGKGPPVTLIISAVVWGYGANSSNPHLASRGKVGVLVSCGAAIICGASVTLINFFWNVGQSV